MEAKTKDGAAATARAMTGASGGGASRTFQSIFGHGPQSQGDGDARIATAKQYGGAEGSQKQQHRDVEEGREADKEGENGDEGDVWDDDFPSDANMESAEEDNSDADHGFGKALSSECRQSMSDWADNDDDEDNWKDALQARVDQLELVVEKKAPPVLPVQLDAALQVETDVEMATIPATTATYAPPVDQRATLTLLPKTNLLRSISAPPAAEEQKPASKMKAPQPIRAVTPSAGPKAKGNSARQPGESVTSPTNQPQVRKRTNSRDLTARGSLPIDQRRLPKTPPAAASTTTSNSVFVRAVVARGNSAGGRTSDTRITSDAHVDKRAKGDDRAAVLALSDAEAVRRHILADVKKISIERIVADAKRLQFLEDLQRRQPDSKAAGPQAVSAQVQNGGSGVSKSVPTKSHAV